MAVEQPGLAAVITRLPEVKKQLAISGVIFSFSLIIESPIIQMLSAATALGRGRNSYRELLGFMHILGAGLTLIHFLTGITPFFDFLILRLIKLPPDYLHDARISFLLMTPFAAAVGYRRLWQGILIRLGKSKYIPAVMTSRLGTTALILITGLLNGMLPGAALGALAISTGVVMGAIGSYLFLRPLLPGMTDNDTVQGTHNLLQFYIPLALTSFINLAARPLLSVGIARAVRPIDSLAVWPVLMGFMFLFNAIALSYQEIVITVIEKPGAQSALKRFAMQIGAGLLILYLLTVLTPLRELWFRTVSGLTPDLMELLPLPVLITALCPPLLTAISYFRGVYISEKRTRTVSNGVIINLVAMTALMLIFLKIPAVDGAVLAAAAYTGAISAEVLFLLIVQTWR